MGTMDLEKQMLGSGLITPNLQPASRLLKRRSPHRMPRGVRLALRRIATAVFCFCLGVIGWSWHAIEVIPGARDPEQSQLLIAPSPSLPRLLSWGQNLSSTDFTSGLSPFPLRRPLVASGSAPVHPDSVYNLHPINHSAYVDAIDEFVSVVLPPRLQLEYQTATAMDGMVGPAHGWDAVGEGRVIWQKGKDEVGVNGTDMRSWSEGSAMSEGWEWRFLSDE